MKMKKIFIGLALLVSSWSFGQQVADEIIGIVGDNIILKSDLDSQYGQAIAQGFPKGKDTKCLIVEDLMFQSLLLNQAQIDSIEVTEAQVEDQIDRRMQYFMMQMNGNPKLLEEYFGKTYLEIKEDLKVVVENNLKAEQMKSNLTSGVKITPAEVRAYFESLDEDSIPLIGSEIEIGQIEIKGKVSEAEKDRVVKELLKIKDQINAGSSFTAKAALYSQDPGSARNGGELGFVGRGQLVPEFEAVAFKLKPGEISNVVESPYGYHLIQLIEKRGEMVNVRHILLIPQVYPSDLNKAKSKIDSIYSLVQKGEMSFAKAAAEFSDDENSSSYGGMMVNPKTGTTSFAIEDVDSKMFFEVDHLKVGEMSEPKLVVSPDGKKSYKIFYLKSKTKPHKASLSTDYQKIQQEALVQKQGKFLDQWLKKQVKENYVMLKEKYLFCDELNKWVKSVN